MPRDVHKQRCLLLNEKQVNAILTASELPERT